MSTADSVSNGGELPARVRAARRARKMTQQQAAERAGIGLRTYQMYENGQTSPQSGNLRAILEAVGLDVDEHADAAWTARDADWPADVQVVRDMIGAFLVTMDVDARLDFVHALTRWIVTGRPPGLDR